MFLVTVLHPIFVMGIVVVLATLIQIFGSVGRLIPDWVRLPIHLVLPLTNLLSEDRFLMIPGFSKALSVDTSFDSFSVWT